MAGWRRLFLGEASTQQTAIRGAYPGRFRDYPGTATASEANKGSGRTSTNPQVIWLQENTLTYRPSLGEKHNLTLLAGESMQVSNRFTSSASVKGYLSNAMPYLNRDTVFNKPSSYQDQ